ncbi:MAG: hypothetical protein ACKVKT_11070 [Rhodospirillales bacterium]
MAIALEFLNLVIPIKNIDRRYPGGWDQCIKDHAHLIGGRVWFDDHLFRDGAMNPKDMSDLLDNWVEIGLITIEEERGKPSWRDCCVVYSAFGFPIIPCRWIEMTMNGKLAFLKGTEPGTAVGKNAIAA